jgi:hypothetical protein
MRSRELDRGGGLWAEYACDIVNEILEGVEFFLDELGRAEAGVLGGLAQFFQPVLMHSSLLRVVAHALEIAFLFHLLHDFVDVAFDVCAHAADFLESFRHFGCLYFADLSVALCLFLEELHVLVADVGNVVHHFCVKITDIVFFSLVASFHALDGLTLRPIVLLQLSQRGQKGWQLLPFPEMRRPSCLLGQFGRAGRAGDTLHCEAIACEMGSTLATVGVGLSLYLDFELGLGVGVIDAASGR